MRIVLMMFLTVWMLPQLAFAMSLDEAKAQGLVGETPSGYLGVVQQTSEAKALAADINAQRKAEYERIAAANGQARSVIEALAAKKAYERTPAGQFVKGADGAWKKK